MRNSLGTVLICGLTVALGTRPVVLKAQLLRGITVEAYVGEPFGVGRISVGGLDGELPLTDSSIFVTEQSGRIHYPSIQSGPARRLLRNLLETRFNATVYFLFRGSAPLDITFYAGRPRRVQVLPVDLPRMHGRLLAQWWREYGLNMQDFSRRSGFAPTVPNYLMVMLSRRLSLPLPNWIENVASLERVDPLDMFLGNQNLAAAIQLRRWSEPASPGTPAAVPVPAPSASNSPAEPAAANDVEIEAMARHVPEEAFYVRFGSFANFRWLREITDKWAADARNLVSRQGIDYDTTPHVERQLAVRESELSKWFGSAIISDVALIGFDANVREGAAVGLLFEARNSFLLGQSLQGSRQAAQSTDGDATFTTENISGREVSLLSRPDNRLRSFHAVDGPYHLVTNSRRLVERFFEAGAGVRPLAEAADFRSARQTLPVGRRDTLFCYLSDRFFENLLSPAYRIEHMRRLKLLADAELLQLGILAAQAEGHAPQSVEDLVQLGFLPPAFGRHAGKSFVTWKEGVLLDSARGALGTFLPMPDAVLEDVESGEVSDFERWRGYIEREWGRMAPVAIGITRNSQPRNDWEQVTVDAYATPLAQRHLTLLRAVLGPPAGDRIVPPDEDVVFGEVVFGGRFTRRNPYKMFVGIRSYDPTLDYSRMQLLFPNGWLRSLEGYTGFTPSADLLSILYGPDYVPAVGESPFRLPFFDGWQRTEGGYTVLAPDRNTPRRVLPLLRQEPATRPAQVRLHVKDLLTSPLASAINRLTYGRSLQVTQSNADLLNLLAFQLGTPRTEALRVTERILGAKLVCPLGGTYVLVDRPGLARHWTSTAVPPDLPAAFRIVPPRDYQFPALSWLRGAEADLLVEGNVLYLHAELLLTPMRPMEEVESGELQAAAGTKVP